MKSGNYLSIKRKNKEKETLENLISSFLPNSKDWGLVNYRVYSKTHGRVDGKNGRAKVTLIIFYTITTI